MIYTKGFQANENFLFSYRRCPYAIRARFALVLESIKFSLMEISLKDKPNDLFRLSAKATVPVLVLKNGNVIDESLEIMLWVFNQTNSTEKYFPEAFKEEINQLINENDTSFKKNLDAYKYELNLNKKMNYLLMCKNFLDKIENLLNLNKFMFGKNISAADIAIFPFIRQLILVDPKKFSELSLLNIQRWYQVIIETECYKAIMIKPS
ncbi:MAG: glutathione S-transferase N-terminal domain-containing protein [Nitrosomonadales bacterium]|jgi:glutathione S-transferase